MKAISAIEFRNRPMTVKILTYCDHCSTLKEGVAKREYNSYWPTVALKTTCCAPCYEIARTKAIAEAKAESSTYC